MNNKSYLGDGLYVEDEGYQIRLYTKRDEGTHEVFLGPDELHNFIGFLERERKLTITVTPNAQ